MKGMAPQKFGERREAADAAQSVLADVDDCAEVVVFRVDYLRPVTGEAASPLRWSGLRQLLLDRGYWRQSSFFLVLAGA